MIDFYTADCLTWLSAQRAGRFDLVLGSPPYEDRRTYNLAGRRPTGQGWVNWMRTVVVASLRVCKGPVFFVLEGHTKQYRYSCTPALLIADLHRAGVCMRKPIVFHRHGIPGGSPDFFRSDWEHVICATNGGRLPYFNPNAMGTPCKHRTGGAFSYRTVDGRRINATKHLSRSKGRPPITKPSDVIHCTVGRGHMGHALAHENEAPYPESLAEYLVRTFCPPNGTVLDPFSGSGTTAAVCHKHGRNCVGLDIRDSQTELAKRRIAHLTTTQPSA